MNTSPMDDDKLKQIIEGALFAAGKTLSVKQLLDLFTDDEKPAAERVRAALKALAQDYEGRALELKEVASGFRFQVREGLSEWVSRLWAERPSRYSRALLETLALVAYRQPITRGEIEDIRGVSVSSSIMKTLQEREWVRVVGHRDVPGKPAMYGTTRAFLDYFNLKSLDELPSLAEIRDIDSINAELNLEIPGVPDSDQAAGQHDAQQAEDEVTGDENAPVTDNDEQARDVHEDDREQAGNVVPLNPKS